MHVFVLSEALVELVLLSYTYLTPKVSHILLAVAIAHAYNLNKRHNKIQQNRLGVTFYTKAIA